MFTVSCEVVIVYNFYIWFVITLKAEGKMTDILGDIVLSSNSELPFDGNNDSRSQHLDEQITKLNSNLDFDDANNHKFRRQQKNYISFHAQRTEALKGRPVVIPSTHTSFKLSTRPLQISLVSISCLIL